MTAQGPIARAVADAVKATSIPDGDIAAVALVRRYATLLDAARGTDEEVRVFTDLGPRLLAALTALGLTAAGRSTKGGVTGGAVDSKLDELRARRAERSAG